MSAALNSYTWHVPLRSPVTQFQCLIWKLTAGSEPLEFAVSTELVRQAGQRSLCQHHAGIASQPALLTIVLLIQRIGFASRNTDVSHFICVRRVAGGVAMSEQEQQQHHCSSVVGHYY